MVLGTMKELKEHAEMMKMHPDMEHHEAHMFEAGMVGKVVMK